MVDHRADCDTMRTVRGADGSLHLAGRAGAHDDDGLAAPRLRGEVGHRLGTLRERNGGAHLDDERTGGSASGEPVEHAGLGLLLPNVDGADVAAEIRWAAEGGDEAAALSGSPAAGQDVG